MSDSGYRTENRCKVCGKHDCFEHATPAQVEGRMDDNRFDDCVRGEAFQTICAEALRARASESALLAEKARQSVGSTEVLARVNVLEVENATLLARGGYVWHEITDEERRHRTKRKRKKL